MAVMPNCLSVISHKEAAISPKIQGVGIGIEELRCGGNLHAHLGIIPTSVEKESRPSHHRLNGEHLLEDRELCHHDILPEYIHKLLVQGE